MEHHHHRQAQEEQHKKQGKLLKETRSSNNSKNKYVGVRQRSSGKWVSEIKDTTKKIRMWLGTFDSAEEAARAYDEAAFLLRGSNTRTNFATQVSINSVLSLKIKNLLNLKNKGSKPPMKPTSSIITTTTPSCSIASNTTSFSSHYNTTTNSGCSSASKNLNSKMFNDANKPDMSYCVDFDQELLPTAMPYLNNSWALSIGFDELPFKFDTEGIELTKGLELSSNLSELELTEFERINVEIERSKISSASLYAMNENECVGLKTQTQYQIEDQTRNREYSKITEAKKKKNTTQEFYVVHPVNWTTSTELRQRRAHCTINQVSYTLQRE